MHGLTVPHLKLCIDLILSHNLIAIQIVLDFTVQYLFAILSQDVIKLPHQMVVDGLSGADVLEFQEHVKGSS